MFALDLQAEPRASEIMLSIHADGRVVAWLGSLRLPPFDTEEARHELRRALNRMEGVHLHRSRVNGWPRFRLEALENPENLMRLVSVLDGVATESHAAVPADAVRPAPDGDAAETIAGEGASGGGT